MLLGVIVVSAEPASARLRIAAWLAAWVLGLLRGTQKFKRSAILMGNSQNCGIRLPRSIP